jgi:hypothetical protein
LNQGQLFWAKQFPDSSIASQVYNADIDMHTYLGEERYFRWQVNMDKCILLDDYNKVDYLVEMGNQYIEEISESDKFKKLIEHLINDNY